MTSWVLVLVNIVNLKRSKLKVRLIHLTYWMSNHHILAQPTLNVLRIFTLVNGWTRLSNTKPVIVNKKYSTAWSFHCLMEFTEYWKGKKEGSSDTERLYMYWLFTLWPRDWQEAVAHCLAYHQKTVYLTIFLAWEKTKIRNNVYHFHSIIKSKL